MANPTEAETRTPADRTLDPLENIDEPEIVELPPFQEGGVECPKCKHMVEPGFTYVSAGDVGPRTARQPYPEHMLRSCWECGYSWREALPV